jgi:hypothetical protein
VPTHKKKTKMRRAGAALVAALARPGWPPGAEPATAAWAWRAKHTATLVLEQRPATAASAVSATKKKKASLADIRAASVFVVNVRVLRDVQQGCRLRARRVG